MMPHIENTTDVTDLRAVAVSLAELLPLEENDDIAREFPSSRPRYTQGIDEAVANLEDIVASCKVGVRQHFVAFAGERAVGMSLIWTTDKVAEDVVGIADLSTPNLSSFVCAPYRNQGLGRLSLAARLQVVREQFGRRAWARVEKGNGPSNKIVTDAGLVQIGETESAYVYAYDANK